MKKLSLLFYLEMKLFLIFLINFLPISCLHGLFGSENKTYSFESDLVLETLNGKIKGAINTIDQIVSWKSKIIKN